MVDNKSLKNLYNELLPVLQTKVNKVRLMGYDYINEFDIWNYFINKEWSNESLSKLDMINDILNTPAYLINDYILSNIHKSNK